MKYQVGLAWLFVFVLEQASSIPISGPNLATRDVDQNRHGKQDGLSLERELLDRARHSEHHGDVGGLTHGNHQKLHRHFVALTGETKPGQHMKPETPGHGSVETDRQKTKETFKDIKENAAESENDGNHGSGEESSEESARAASYDSAYSVNGDAAGSDVEGADVSSEEKEILRTVLLTLRDNPDLIKILMETEDKELDDEFFKQKQGVSDPESSELWGNFPDEQSPKQIEKKAGHRSSELRGYDSEHNSPLNKDGVIQLPVNTAERQPPNEEEIKADVSLESDAIEQSVNPQSSEADGLSESSVVNSEMPHSTGEENGRLLEDGFVDSKIPKATGEDSKGLLEDGFVDSGKHDVTEKGNVRLLEDGFVPSNRQETVKVEEPKNEVAAGSLESGVAESKVKVKQDAHAVTKPVSADNNEELELQALSELNREFARLEEEHGAKLHM